LSHPEQINLIAKACSMKRVLLLTDIDFWRRGAGHRMRILELVKYIATYSQLSIIYIGAPHEINVEEFNREFNCNLIILTSNRINNARKYGKLLEHFLRFNHFDVCIVEYIHLSFYLHYFPYPIIKILDLHDIMTDRDESFRKFNYETATYGLTKGQEYQLYKMYDYIMVLCKPDFYNLLAILPAEKLLLCPHPVAVSPRRIRPKASCIGFVASEYLPNKDAIQHFCRECWPLVSPKYDVHLNIYGKVTSTLDEVTETSYIHLKGWLNSIEEIYDETDIIINPVRIGAGLKIKNIEALAYGLPLITTSHGARGLEKGRNEAFVTADNCEDFSNSLIQLIQNFELREKLGRKAHKFVLQEFSQGKCFKPLIRKINSN
jgi:glycosyltransferase involved in cell wall biosynthesis